MFNVDNTMIYYDTMMIYDITISRYKTMTLHRFCLQFLEFYITVTTENQALCV